MPPPNRTFVLQRFPQKINTTMPPQHLPHQQHHNNPYLFIMGHQHIASPVTAVSPIDVVITNHTHQPFLLVSACAQAAASQKHEAPLLSPNTNTANHTQSTHKSHSNLSKQGAPQQHLQTGKFYYYYLYINMEMKSNLPLWCFYLCAPH